VNILASDPLLFYSALPLGENRMTSRITLGDLRNDIQEIYREVMSERSDGEASNNAVLKRIHERKRAALAALAPELLNIALTKLLNDVSNRRGARSLSSGGSDLFGEFRIPVNITISRGKKKNTAKMSFKEAEFYLNHHADKESKDRHDSLRRLVDACRQFVETPEDTLELLLERRKRLHRPALDL
jgi:hypothetical protein